MDQIAQEAEIVTHAHQDRMIVRPTYFYQTSVKYRARLGMHKSGLTKKVKSEQEQSER